MSQLSLKQQLIGGMKKEEEKYEKMEGEAVEEDEDEDEEGEEEPTFATVVFRGNEYQIQYDEYELEDGREFVEFHYAGMQKQIMGHAAPMFRIQGFSVNGQTFVPEEADDVDENSMILYDIPMEDEDGEPNVLKLEVEVMEEAVKEAIAALDGDTLEDIKEVFEEIDSDGSGSLERDEVIEHYQKRLERRIRGRDVKEIGEARLERWLNQFDRCHKAILAIDMDEDEHITLDEFMYIQALYVQKRGHVMV